MNNQEIEHLVWWAKDRVRGFMTGLHRRPDFGFSLDFAQHRAYVPGDAPKFIDWSVLARQDKVLTKQYEAESNLRAYFVLDSSSSMFVEFEGRSKWDYTVKLFTLISSVLQKQRDALGLMEVREDAHHFFEAKNTSEQIASMLSHLKGKSLISNKNADFSAAFDELLSRVPARSQVILMMDVFDLNLDLLEQSLSKARTSKHQMIVIALDDPIESNAEHLKGREVVDSETGDRLFFTSDMQEGYKDFQKGQLKSIEELCGKVGGHFFRINIDDDLMVSLGKLLTA